MNAARVIAVIITLATVAISAQANTCSEVLISQTESRSFNSEMELSWLTMIDSSNYATAKLSGGGKYLDMFSGNFSSFFEKRKKYLDQKSFKLKRNEAEEVFKSHLTDQQISAWLECKRSNREIALYAKDIDKFGATLVIEWPSQGDIGPLTETKVNIDNAQAVTELPAGEFSGTSRTLLTRVKPEAPIRGTVSGKAGVVKSNYSADIYIPAYAPEVDRIEPVKVVVTQNGVVKKSIAYWAHGKASASWDCLPSSSGMDLIEINVAGQNRGRSRGKCVGKGSYCDSHGESCRDEIITQGCFVNTELLPLTEN